MKLRPLFPRLRSDHHFHAAGREWLRAVVVPPRLDRDEPHIGEAQDDLSDVLAEFSGLSQGGSLGEVRPHPDRSFVHVGQKFETQPRHHPHRNDGQDAQRRRDHQPAAGNQPPQHHRIHGTDQGQQPVLRFVVALPEHDRRQDRHNKDRKQKAPAREKTIVSAIGRNSNPSMLVNDSKGT